MVVSGVEAESTTIISGSRYIVDDEVGIGVLAGELVSLVRHCTICLVEEIRNTCSSIVRELQRSGQT